MSTLQDQMDALVSRIQEEKNNGMQDGHPVMVELLETQKTLQKQIDDAATAEREQVQEAAVQDITLPFDLNEAFDDPRANDIVIEIVRQFQRQANAEHNVEIDQIKAELNDRIKSIQTATSDAATQSEQEITNLQQQLSTAIEQAQLDEKELMDLTQKNVKLALEKHDAEQKRDAAANELEQANLEIERLNKLLNDVPAPKSAIDIAPTDKLAQMFKESAADKAARALARWNDTHPEQAVQPLALPPLSPVETTIPEVTQEDFRSGDNPTEGSSLVQPGTDVVEEDHTEIPAAAEIQDRRQNSLNRMDNIEQALAQLTARVDRIEQQPNIGVVA